jgi:hypothetical protein
MIIYRAILSHFIASWIYMYNCKRNNINVSFDVNNDYFKNYLLYYICTLIILEYLNIQF